MSNAHGEGGERTKNPNGENYHLEVSKNNYDQNKQYAKDDDDDAILTLVTKMKSYMMKSYMKNIRN